MTEGESAPSGGSTGIPPSAGEQQPPPQAQPQVAQPPAEPSARQPVGPSRQDLFDAINSIPEKVADAVKELAPKPAKSAVPKDGSNGGGNTTAKNTSDGSDGVQNRNLTGREKFVKWWHGG